MKDGDIIIILISLSIIFLIGIPYLCYLLIDKINEFNFFTFCYCIWILPNSVLYIEVYEFVTDVFLLFIIANQTVQAIFLYLIKDKIDFLFN